MAFDNFTVNVVSFNETEGADWTQSRPSVTLIITPNAGYEIDVNNFTSINTLPPQVQSVSFTQSGANIDCIILYNSPQTMPASNVLIALCISGFASLIGVSVGGVVNYYTTFTSTPIPPSVSTSYSGTGLIFSTSGITNLTVTAIACSCWDIDLSGALPLTLCSRWNVARRGPLRILTVVGGM